MKNQISKFLKDERGLGLFGYLLVIFLMVGLIMLVAEFPYVLLIIPLWLIIWFIRTWIKGDKSNFWAGIWTGFYFIILSLVVLILFIVTKDSRESHELSITMGIALLIEIPIIIVGPFEGVYLYCWIKNKLDPRYPPPLL